MPATRVQAPPRQGPRPLPLHLATALLTLGGSESAWTLLNGASPNSKPTSSVASDGGASPSNPRSPQQGPAENRRPSDAAFAASLAVLRAEVDAATRMCADGGDDPFRAALRRQIGVRLNRVASGILAYRRHPAHRALPAAPVLWSEGSTEILDYGVFGETSSQARAVLVVPSLVNRWEVLDLTEDKSFLRALARAGWRPLLVDWGAPGAAERDYDSAGYVGRLERALVDLAPVCGPAAPVALGYCMGGTLTVALAARRRSPLSALVALAAPWDFHADRSGHTLLATSGPSLADLAQRVGELPVDVLQMLFWSLDPWMVLRKFERFAALDPDSAAAREFVLLEDWLNGGAPLPAPLARETLMDWYRDNLPGKAAWVVGGTRVDPIAVAAPTLVATPAQDRIVPPLSAAALADPVRGVPGATRLDLAFGHIGMIVSARAAQRCWRPIFDWLRQAAPP